MDITADDFARRFEDGEDLAPHSDMGKIRRAGHELQRVNVDFPSWMINTMDNEASRLGVSRQALIKFVMDTHLQNIKAQHV